MSRTESELIADAIEHLEVLRSYVERADLDEQIIADAVSLRLAAALECLARTSEAFRDTHFGDDWPAMWSTRNRIAHGYLYIDLAIIRSTVTNDLPGLLDTLRRAVSAD